MARKCSARVNASFARYTRPPSAIDELVQRIDQRLRLRRDRQVERVGHAGLRKRQHAPALGAAVFDDAQEDGRVELVEPRQKAARGGSSSRARGQHALVLREAARPVDAIPVADHIERIEERLRMHDAAAHAGAVL